MSIVSEITRINGNINNSYTAVDDMGGTLPQIQNSANLEAAIRSIPQGGGATGEDVVFYDYDGTVLYSYSANDFLALSAMPANPSHTGLTAQGWNWTLADAKTYVTDYGMLDIGQMYTTTSGLSEFDIELTPVTGLSVTLNMNGTKDWGDGTTDTLTTHTYLDYGDYTITCDGTMITDGLFGQASSPNYYCTNIRLTNVTSLSSGCFYNCYSLRTITLSNNLTSLTTGIYGGNAFRGCYSLISVIVPSDVTSLGNYTFQNCYLLEVVSLPKNITNISTDCFSSCEALTTITIPNNVSSLAIRAFSGCLSLQSIIIPDSVTSIGNSVLSGCYSLQSIIIPDSVTSIGSSVLQNCYSLQSIIIPDSVTSIGSSVLQNCYSLQNVIIGDSVTSIETTAFSNCYSLTTYDFSNVTAIPTLSNINAFSGINKIAKIIVPSSLYNDWIVATNWSTYADYIYKASEVL